MTAPLLAVESLVVHYRARQGGGRERGRVVHAVCDVSFEVGADEALGLVGESGCGKTTISRAIVGLQQPTSGRVAFRGADLASLSRSRLRRMRRDVQMVFQDPHGSLDPRMRVGDIVAEPLHVHGRYRDGGWERVVHLLADVGLPASFAERFPRELSGGQRQRVGIARALATGPRLLVLDEPVSALDVSVRAGVVNLLADLRSQQDLAYLLVAHDLALVRHVCDRIAVMYLGRIVEVAGREELFARPGHPYTQALISAVPVPDPRVERSRERIVLAGDPPAATGPPSGCRFRTRCQLFAGRLTDAERVACIEEPPALVPRGQGHPVACHYA